MIDMLSIFRKTALNWMPQNVIDDKSSLVQVMACFRQATYYHLMLPNSMSKYVITKPKRVQINGFHIDLHENIISN